MNHKFLFIKKIYLYLLALIGIVLVLVGGVKLINLGLKTFIFTEAEQFYPYPSPKPVPTIRDDAGKEIIYEEPSPEELVEYYEKSTRSRREAEAANSLALIIVGLPLYLYHWNIIRKEKNND